MNALCPAVSRLSNAFQYLSLLSIEIPAITTTLISATVPPNLHPQWRTTTTCTLSRPKASRLARRRRLTSTKS